MLSKLQYGFRAEASAFAFYDIVECISETRTRKYQLVPLSLIFQKLLILLTILCCYGSWNIATCIQGLPLQLLENDLHRQKQYWVLKRWRSQTQLVIYYCGSHKDGFHFACPFHSVDELPIASISQPHYLLMVHV